jgi:hypothetical protein
MEERRNMNGVRRRACSLTPVARTTQHRPVSLLGPECERSGNREAARSCSSTGQSASPDGIPDLRRARTTRPRRGTVRTQALVQPRDEAREELRSPGVSPTGRAWQGRALGERARRLDGRRSSGHPGGHRAAFGCTEDSSLRRVVTAVDAIPGSSKSPEGPRSAARCPLRSQPRPVCSGLCLPNGRRPSALNILIGIE